MKLSKIGAAMLAGAAVIALAITALHIRARRNEATTFPAGDPRDRVWATTPVVVSASADVAKHFERQVREAVRDLNNEVGCTVLTTSGTTAQVRVLTIIDDPCRDIGRPEPLPDTAGGATYVCPELVHGQPVPQVTDILLSGGLVEPRKAYVIIKHELGHALGLDDDPGSDDVMAPHLTEESWQDWRRPLPWLSSRDRTALADRYCNRGGPDAK